MEGDLEEKGTRHHRVGRQDKIIMGYNNNNNAAAVDTRVSRWGLLFPLVLLIGCSWVHQSIAWVIPSPSSSSSVKTTSPTNIKQRRGRICSTVLYQDYMNGNDGNDDNEDIEYYDDFGFVVGGENNSNDLEQVPAAMQSSSSQSSSILQDRLQELAVTEQANQQQITDNWKEGYWNVWGCSLDPYDPEGSGDSSSLSKTIITCLRLVSSTSTYDDDDTALLVVGRSDGSICWLQMDVSTPPSVSSYDTTQNSLQSRSTITYFENKLTAKPTGEGGFVVNTELQLSNNDDGGENSMDQQQEQQKADESDDLSSPPFDIIAQLSTSTTTPSSSIVAPAIIDMVVLNKSQMLWTISQASSNTIQVWKLYQDNESGLLLPEPQQTSTPFQSLEAIHTSPIVGMKIFPSSNNNNNEMIITVADNGEVVLWEVENDNISTLYQGNILQQYQTEENNEAPMSEFSGGDDFVLSMDVDEENLYLGTQSGRIFIFSLTSMYEDEVSHTTMLPLVKSFMGFSNREPGVSAICAAGPGSLRSGGSPANSSRSRATKSLIAGNVLGELKQWELIPTGSGGLEYWPRMASQRLPNKAHVFETDQTFLTTEERNDMTSQTIRGLMCIQQVILTATNQDLKVWDPETGKALYDMKGLDFGIHERGLHPSMVVARDSVLVTNGMEQYGEFVDRLIDRFLVTP